ncbi:hypothetical protein O181_062055 [Austropuccinia psidii MF-1]|uniref:Uncharacterized protein n=1 Tax=Austropuccinia psidii MF-1 TaxID=1389203 RepID=A0A9Q3I114_9BASI|nr:hypothetical protein [Austropuccinia psidii MF-1]
MEPKRDLCVCTKCINHKFLDDSGISRQGRYVHPSTRRRHWNRNSQPVNQSMENKLMGLSLDGFPDLTSQERKYCRRDTEIQDTPDSEQSKNQGYDPVNTNHCNKHYLVLFVKFTTSQANMINI